jgi:hypothetical protein
MERQQYGDDECTRDRGHGLIRLRRRANALRAEYELEGEARAGMAWCRCNREVDRHALVLLPENCAGTRHSYFLCGRVAVEHNLKHTISFPSQNGFAQDYADDIWQRVVGLAATASVPVDQKKEAPLGRPEYCQRK